MKLIKLTDDHYIIVDDSEVRPGDYVYTYVTNKVVDFTDPRHFSDGTYKKITHSTRAMYKDEYISLQEVKELIGEKSWKGYIDGTEWEVEIESGKIKDKSKLKNSDVCSQCGGDSWRFNNIQSEIKYCKCGADFKI